MNDFFDNISFALKTCLGANVVTFLMEFIFIEELLLFIKYAVYIIAFISVCLNLYFKWKQAKMDIEIKQMKKESAQNEKDNRFVFHKDYSEDDKF